ncbi:MAG TPA: molybdopterin-dependent oxidoreductase [Syntrophomonas sp.]|nr:molybdopterin-dependent oxidoreductase [Syntrophomonas sp.]
MPDEKNVAYHTLAEQTNAIKNKSVDENGVQWTKIRCFFCNAHCPLYVGAKDGKIIELRPNTDLGGILCERMGPKGDKAIRFHYHPKRINHALKRVGKRGEDKWEQIPYAQAMDEIAAKLQKIKNEYGPEALVVSEGTYRSDHLWARSRFTNLFGNPGNIIDPGTICWCWTYTVNMSMVGWPIEMPVPPGAAEANTIVLWGNRPSEKNTPEGALWKTMQMSMKREGEKAKLIVIDPVCTEEVLQSTQWLPIRPGTDLILALSWCNYIISNKLYDEKFLKDWTNGVFLIRKDNQQLLRACDVDKSGKQEDFIVWNNNTDSVAVWCSDENHYYGEANVDAPLYGDYEVTLEDGSKVACMTAFDAIAESMKEYTIERASHVTGVSEIKIREAAHTYATNGPAYICWGIGGGDQHGYNSTYQGIAKTMLRILSGNIDVPGGEYIGDPGPISDDGQKYFPVRDSEFELSDMVTPETRAKFLGNDQFRMMSWKGFEIIDKCYRKMYNIPRPQLHHMLVTPPLAWDAILKEEPYPVKAVIAWSSNPLAWAPNTKHVYEALKSLDLLVVVDYWKTPTAALADYILPAADSLERPLATTFEDGFDFMLVGDRAVEPEYDRHMDYEFFRELGMRLGQEKYWPWERYEDVIKHRLERVDISYEQAVEDSMVVSMDVEYYKYEKILPNGQIRGFATPSRKCEIFSSAMQDMHYNPIPFYRELPETPLSNPEMAKEYPLRLTVGGRWVPMFHSEFRVPGGGTRSMFPWPRVQMHITDGRNLGIRDGDWVWIETPRGRIRQVAKLGWDIIRGTVIVQPSWWMPELPAEEPWSQGVFESNGNVLVDDSIDKLDEACGQWTCRGLLCKVYPCIDPADRSDAESPVENFTYNNKEGLFHKQFEHLK